MWLFIIVGSVHLANPSLLSLSALKLVGTLIIVSSSLVVKDTHPSP